MQTYDKSHLVDKKPVAPDKKEDISPQQHVDSLKLYCDELNELIKNIKEIGMTPFFNIKIEGAGGDFKGVQRVAAIHFERMEKLVVYR